MNVDLLRQLSWPELRHHPWRHGAALLAVTLGVALAFSVQLINGSALGEFGAAVRAVNGEADLELRGPAAGMDEAVYAEVAGRPEVSAASPIVELSTQMAPPRLIMEAIRLTFYAPPVTGDPSVLFGQGD